MAELYPYPFPALVRRMFAELEAKDSIFDLPRGKWFTDSKAAGRDLSVEFHGKRAATPLGPAAGPQSQMAQNLVLSWLAGCRIMELKTVQINDELDIPRPCIDMATVGYNVEWSQELKISDSLGEYVKGMMLIEMLKARGVVDVSTERSETLYDMSVGYDLAGIKSPTVQSFIRGMMDATEVIEGFRGEIPAEFSDLKDIAFPTRLSDTLTLSTFHGCPPDEIEGIIDFLLRDMGINCIVKLNPTLLGPTEVPRLLNEALGYDDVRVPPKAFDADTTWPQAQAFVERLGATAKSLGLGFGVKFSNTLIVENRRDFFPASEKEMYLSGQPLHVIAMHLVRMFRRRFGSAFPISFSAGIDRKNFADAVANGLVPVTVCSDLCRVGGYGRTSGYFKDLTARMNRVGANDIPSYILQAYGKGVAALDGLDGMDEAQKSGCLTALAEQGDLRAAAGAHFDAWVAATTLLNTELYVGGLTSDARYGKAKNSKPPRKLGTMLELFDCITCDKCVPVCPNNANFLLKLPPLQLPIAKATSTDGGIQVHQEGVTALAEKHQIANYADFCNECGNCDIFCPEDGGPYILKPRFFGSEDTWREFSSHDGFFFQRNDGQDRLLGRFSGVEYTANVASGEVSFQGPGFALQFPLADPASGISGTISSDGADLTYWYILNALRGAIYDSGDVNYVQSLAQ